VRIRWFRCLLGIRMPHASCLIRANGCRTVYATRAGMTPPLPINCHEALSREASHFTTPLSPQLSLFGIQTIPRETSSFTLNTCRPVKGHLPASSMVPNHLGASKLAGLGLSGCPRETPRRTDRAAVPLGVSSTSLSRDARPSMKLMSEDIGFDH